MSILVLLVSAEVLFDSVFFSVSLSVVTNSHLLMHLFDIVLQSKMTFGKVIESTTFDTIISINDAGKCELSSSQQNLCISIINALPASIYLLRVNNRNTKTQMASF